MGSSLSNDFVKYMQQYDKHIIDIEIKKQIPILVFETKEDKLVYELKFPNQDLTELYALWLMYQEPSI